MTPCVVCGSPEHRTGDHVWTEEDGAREVAALSRPATDPANDITEADVLENDIRELRGAEPGELARRLIERGWARPAGDCAYECPFTPEGHKAHDVDHEFVPALSVAPCPYCAAWHALDHNADNAR